MIGYNRNQQKGLLLLVALILVYFLVRYWFSL